MSNGFIRSLANEDYALAYSDFTVEVFIKPIDIGFMSQTIFDISDSNGTHFYNAIDNGMLRVTGLGNNGNLDISGTEAVTANVRHFVSIERQANCTYLFLDGVLQGKTTSTFSIVDEGTAGQITIGVDFSNSYPFIGEIGDFKITKGIAKNVSAFYDVPEIKSNFLDTTLGSKPQDTVIDGGDFSNHFDPEELVPLEISDSLQIQVSQIAIGASNTSTPILGFNVFKPYALTNGINTLSITGNGNTTYTVPWDSLLDSSAAVTIDGVPIASNQWSVSNRKLSFSTGNVSGNIVVTLTGPTTYNLIGANTVSVLTGNVYANAQSIALQSTAHFDVPASPDRGYAFINGELISYLTNDTTTNTLSGLMRGVNGTGVPTVHEVGEQVMCTGNSTLLSSLTNADVGGQLWTTANSGVSFQNAASTISTVLLSAGSVIVK